MESQPLIEGLMRNPWSSEFLGCRWEPQKIKPQSLMVNDVNTQPFLVILGCFLMEFTGKKITPGHCQSVNAQIPSSVSFVRNLRAYVMKGFGAHSDTPTIGIMGEVGCSVFFAGWIPFGQGAGFLDFTLDCAFCGVSRNFQKLLTSSQRRQISA